MKQVAQRYEEAVPVGKLRLHPKNANEGARAVIAESLAENGFYGAVYAHEPTGYIIAGNHRWDEAVKAGAETIPVIWLDVDEQRADKLLAVDNRSARLGHDDHRRLADLLEGFQQDFTGTGYTEKDYQDLLASLAPDPLDELATQYGEPVAAALWPEFKVKCPPSTKARALALLQAQGGETDADKFTALLDLVDMATTGMGE